MVPTRYVVSGKHGRNRTTKNGVNTANDSEDFVCDSLVEEVLHRPKQRIEDSRVGFLFLGRS